MKRFFAALAYILGLLMYVLAILYYRTEDILYSIHSLLLGFILMCYAARLDDV